MSRRGVIQDSDEEDYNNNDEERHDDFNLRDKQLAAEEGTSNDGDNAIEQLNLPTTSLLTQDASEGGSVDRVPKSGSTSTGTRSSNLKLFTLFRIFEQMTRVLTETS